MATVKHAIKKLLLCLMVGFLYFPLQAQQQGQYSQYMMNYFLINPAAAGVSDVFEFRSGYRKQWSGIAGAPRNYYASAHVPITKARDERINRRKIHTAYHSGGALFSGQTIGALTHNTGYLSYAYHLPVSVDYTLSMGMNAGINQYALQPDKLHFSDDDADAAVGNVNNIKPDLSLGLWLYSERLFVGLSSMQILQNRLAFSPESAGSGMLNRHYMLTGGYNFAINDDLRIIPSLLLKKTTTAFQVDVNTKVRYKDLAWAGLSYRRVDAMVFLAGVGIPLRAAPKGSSNHERVDAEVGRIEIGYAYDYVTSALSNYSKGSHEIMLALILPIELKIKNRGRSW